MTYEKHIEALENLDQYALAPDIVRDLIELMRASEPKDAAAEREHCYRVSHAIVVADDMEREIELTAEMRTQARAEGYAAGRKDGEASLSPIVVGELEARLAAAQAEIESLRTSKRFGLEVSDIHAKEACELQAKLAAAQAEIAHWRRELERLQLAVASGVYRDEISELETKLANLRAAAERVDQEGWRLAGCTRETLSALRAAIEASKS